MLIRFILFFVLLLAILIEAIAIRIPLTLVVLLIFTMMQKKSWAFFLAIFSGLLLDSLTFRTLGTTGAFFLLAVGILFLYDRKYEMRHIGFAAVFLFISCIVYEFIFGLPSPVVASAVAVLLGLVMLFPLNILSANQPQNFLTDKPF